MSSINISIKKSKIISIILIWSLIWIGFIGLLVFDGVIDNTLVQGKTIIVDPNGKGNYTKIQYAIENASSGDIIRVWDGIYYEALTINKTLSIIGNGSSSTIIDADYNGNAIYIKKNNVNLSGFHLRNSSGVSYNAQIILDNANFCNISNNVLSPNSHSIILLSSNSNIIINNSFSASQTLIYLENSRMNKLINNTLNGRIGPWFSKGIHFENSPFNLLYDNNMHNCGIYILGTEIQSYLNNVNNSNQINNKRIYYLINQSNIKIPSDAGQILLINCTNITIKNLAINNATKGIYIYNSTFISIINNSFNNSGWATQIIGSSNISFEKNYLYKNNWNGLIFSNCYNNHVQNNTFIKDKILIRGNSFNISVENNKLAGLVIYESNNNVIINNYKQYFGISLTYSDTNIFKNNSAVFRLEYSNNNIIVNNSFDGIGTDGVWLSKSHNNYLQGNHFSNSSSGNGISAFKSDGTIFIDNIIDNFDYGFYMSQSSHNLIINNSITNSWYQGLYFFMSINNTIINSTSSYNNGDGVYGGDSGPFKIRNSSFNSNGGRGILLDGYSSNSLINVKVRSNGDNGIILSNAGTDYFNNVTSYNNSGYGLRDYAGNNNVINCTFIKNSNIGLYMPSNNKIINSKFLSNGNHGLRLSGNNQSIIDSEFTNNAGSGFYGGLIFSQIENNSFKNNSNYGIELYSSSNTEIINNSIMDNNNDGIYLYNAKRDQIDDNDFQNNKDHGIFMNQSWNNSFDSNYFTNEGIFILGQTLDNFIHIINVTNKVNNKPIYYYKNQNSISIPNDAGEIILAGCNEISINDIKTRNSSVGIEMAFTSNSIIYEGNLSGNKYGTYLYKSFNNNFIGNKITNNHIGIFLDVSFNNKFINSTLTSNIDYDINLKYNSKGNIALNTTFNTIHFHNKTSELYIQNYLSVETKDAANLPIVGADLLIEDNGNPIYITSGYSGTDKKTDSNGQINWIEVTDRTYIDSNEVVENQTKVSSKFGMNVPNNNERSINMAKNRLEIFEFDFLPSKILILAPNNQSYIGDTTPELRWMNGNDEKPGLLKYNVQVDENGGDWSNLMASQLTNEGILSWNVTPSLSDGTYIWRVRAFDGNEYGPWSDVWQFSIDASIPLANKPDGNCIFNNTGIINWTWTPSVNSLSGIAGYFVYIGTTPSTYDLINGDWTLNNWYVGMDLEDAKTYYCKIKAKTNVDTIGDYSQQSDPILVDLTMPKANKPYASTKYNNTGMVKWHWEKSADTGSGIEGYFVTIESKKARSIIVSDYWTINNWYEIEGLIDSFSYSCKIKAKNGAGTVGEYGEISESIIVDMIAPTKPIELTIEPNDWSNTNNFTIDWMNPSDLSGIKIGAYYINNKIPDSQNDGEWTSKKSFEILNADEGLNDIYIWLEDNAGNSDFSNYANGNLKFDMTKPRDISILINNNVIKTEKTTVDLTLFAIDELSGLKSMSFSFDGIEWNIWEPFKTEKSINIQSGDGEKTIYFRVMDNAGNIADSVFDTILLNTSTTEKPLDGPDDDGDGIPDVWEQINGLDPLDPSDALEDIDGDDLSNLAEYQHNTDPNKNDTDRDGLNDGLEINTMGTNASNPDSDSDGYNDKNDKYPLNPNKWEDNEEPEPEPETKTPDEKETNWGLIGGAIVAIIIVVIVLFFLFIKPRLGVKKPPEEPPKEVPQKPTETEQKS